MSIYLKIAIALIVLLVVVIVIKAMTFKPCNNKEKKAQPLDIDSDKLAETFSQFIQCKTISVTDKENGDYSQFDKFIALIQEKYPLVFAKCSFNRVDNYGLVLKFDGASSENPAVYMSHYDVVPVKAERWSVEPFDGVRKDGKVYGRGTCDNKATLLCMMEAMEYTLSQNAEFKPNNDLYFTFGADEEIDGTMQVSIADYLVQNGVKAKLVLDEGGAIVENVFPGVNAKTAVIGLCEKGTANVELSVNSTGGHASTPSKNDPVNVLSRAINAIESHPMKAEINPAVNGMIDTLGRHSTFALKLVFGNMWLFKGLVKLLFTKISGETNAMLNTTFAFTTLKGSMAKNVLPSQASVNVNIRIAPQHNIDMVVSHIKKVVNDNRVNVKVVTACNASPIADMESEAYKIVKQTMGEVYSDVIVSPYIMLAASDSRHYSNVSNGVLKFAPFELSKIQRKAIHGDDEYIEIEALSKGVEFYHSLIQKA